MSVRPDRPQFWPLLPGALTAKMLRPFAPIGYDAIAQAYDLGFINQTELGNVVRENLLPTESPYLRIFVDTASTFDRQRDIQEELGRLAREHASGPPLWTVLARVILESYDDSDEAVRTLQQLYQWTGEPEALRPFTLIGGEYAEGVSKTKEIVQALETFLRKQH